MGTEESKKIWEENAQFWDNAMGDESNEFHREVVRPKVTELLSPNPAALADAISVLPEQTREEILRYYFLRQPQRVIGACIGRSRSTAGRHIQLALQRLREEMGVSRYE